MTPLTVAKARSHGANGCQVLQVLVQSFMWADKLKDEEARAEAQAAASRFTSAMSAEPEVSLEHLFAARQGTAVTHCNITSALLPMHSFWRSMVSQYQSQQCEARLQFGPLQRTLWTSLPLSYVSPTLAGESSVRAQHMFTLAEFSTWYGPECAMSQRQS